MFVAITRIVLCMGRRDHGQEDKEKQGWDAKSFGCHIHGDELRRWFYLQQAIERVSPLLTPFDAVCRVNGVGKNRRTPKGKERKLTDILFVG